MPVDESAPIASPKAPADLVAPPSLRERFAWYVGAVVVTGAVLFAGLRLDSASIKAPLAYDDDALLIMPMVKSTLERGSHWRNERMGYPGIQELHDFPVIDHLHFAILWLLGRVVSDWVVVYNLYYLLTYPLTTLTGMYAFRRLGLTLSMAAAGGLLYSFLPYHYMRGEAHYFLAAYWLVPLSWLPALAISRGALPFFRLMPDRRYRTAFRTRETLFQVLLAAATSSAGAYYAFFACAIYAFAGLYGWVFHRTWKSVASAGLLVGIIVIVGVLNHLPSIVYAQQYGRNSVAERTSEEAETYGLKIAQLLLPVDGHNVTFLGQIKSAYCSGMRPFNNENTSATLGIVGSTGLVLLFAALLFSSRREWPLGPLASFAAFIIVFATIGGIGAIFNLIIFDQVRCLNRFSIYLAFICQFAVLFKFDRFLVSRVGRARRVRVPAALAIAIFGIVDQTPSVWFAKAIATFTRLQQDRFLADRQFFSAIENHLNVGPSNPLHPDAPWRVFNLPYMPFPEVPPAFDMNAYEHSRGYLHTQNVVWSYGAIKNREADAWQRDVVFNNVDRESYADYFLPRIVYRGFDAILIDTRGFSIGSRGNKGSQLIKQIKDLAEKQAHVNLPEIVHSDTRQVFLDLRPYRDYLWNLDRGHTFEAEAALESDWVALLWLRGFVCIAPNARRDDFRWGYSAGRATIINPSNRTRTFKLSMRVGVEAEGEFIISIDGNGLVHLDRDGGSGPWVDRFSVEKPDVDPNSPKHGHAVQRSYLLEVPPGRHPIEFRCKVPSRFMPGNLPAYCYYIKDVAFFEVK